jgi:hypothetical protein
MKWGVCSGRDSSDSISGSVKHRCQLSDYQLFSKDYCVKLVCSVCDWQSGRRNDGSSKNKRVTVYEVAVLLSLPGGYNIVVGIVTSFQLDGPGFELLYEIDFLYPFRPAPSPTQSSA